MKLAPAVRWTALAAILVAFASPPAQAQKLLAQAFGEQAYDNFGLSIASGGPDLDGDGFSEIAVGADIFFRPSIGYSPGAVYVLSGRDFTTIHAIYGSDAYDQLGSTVAWCDDLDGDGLSDLVVGLPGYTGAAGSTGSVQIYSTGTWTLLRQFDGVAPWGFFGGRVARLGDTDGDGVAELIVGSPDENVGIGMMGAVYVYSGTSGALLQKLTASGTRYFGAAVADVGDVNGDGVDDIGVGAPGSDYPYPYYPKSGAAYVFSGADGSQLYKWHGSCFRSSSYYYGNELGVEIGAAGDVDGDGRDDVWVAAEYGVPPFPPAPAFVAIYSGATGATIRAINAGEYLDSAASVGDLDGDGITDFAVGGVIQVGGPNSYRSAVMLLSGGDGRELWREDDPNTLSWLGSALAATQDVNQDGRPDVAIGAMTDDTVATDAGRVDLLGSSDLWLDVRKTHRPRAGDAVTLTALEGPPGNLVGLFLTAVHGTPTFSLLQLTTFDPSGQAQWSSTIPKGFSGVSFALRAIAIGPTGKLIQSADETIAIQ